MATMPVANRVPDSVVAAKNAVSSTPTVSTSSADVAAGGDQDCHQAVPEAMKGDPGQTGSFHRWSPRIRAKVPRNRDRPRLR